MVRNQVVIDLARRRQQREMDAIYRCIRRAVDVPERLIGDVLGPDEAHFRRDPLREQVDDAGLPEAWEPDDYDVATGRVAVARWTG